MPMPPWAVGATSVRVASLAVVDRVGQAASTGRETSEGVGDRASPVALAAQASVRRTPAKPLARSVRERRCPSVASRRCPIPSARAEIRAAKRCVEASAAQGSDRARPRPSSAHPANCVPIPTQWRIRPTSLPSACQRHKPAAALATSHAPTINIANYSGCSARSRRRCVAQPRLRHVTMPLRGAWASAA